MMKSLFISILLSTFFVTITSSYAGDRYSRYDHRSYGDNRYKLEKEYPSPERRYSRNDLDKARRRANNSVWMKHWGNKDPIYQSDQYRGRSSRSYSQPYRTNRWDHQW